MDEPGLERAQQIARVACAFERDRTGHLAESVTVALAGETLVVSLHGALSPAERATAATPGGAGLVREFHRMLFAGVSGPLRREVERILGTEVREANAEAQGVGGTIVLVFLLAGSVPAETWSGAPPVD